MEKETKVEPEWKIKFREKFLIERKDSESQEFKEKVNDYLISELEQFIENVTKEAEDKGYAEGVRYTEKKYQSSEPEWKTKFRDEIYGKNDALFDRSGNNVSQQVENFISDLLISQRSQLIKEIEGFAIMKGSVIDKLVEKDEHARITNLLNENLEIGYRQACRDLLTLLKT